MSYTVSHGLGTVHSAEVASAYKPRYPRVGKYGVALLHGAGNPMAWASSTWPNADRLAVALANAGIYSVSSMDTATPLTPVDLWANDAHMTRVGEHRTALGVLGADSSKMHLIGISMGGGAAIRWAAANPTLVASVVGIIPLSNIDWMYQNDVSSSRAGIGTAWGVTFPTALPAGSNLATAAAVLNTNHIPVRLYYSSVDTLIRSVDVTSIASASGGTAFNIDSTFGHANGTVGQMLTHNGGTEFSDLVAFLKANGA